ncbi:MAG: hypothetical protein EZS28_008059 [Streblomastix strix]|uniref:Uncharacterized protein n=1 Tax=Streblomastix strix TaxID=222440 RepID=A0A5J4WNC0_9EUKA|nr:MAG: hypothetical protein EZS28_008059 [Streblomastix strix]
MPTLGSSSSRHLHYPVGNPSNQFRSVFLGHVHPVDVYPSMHLHVFEQPAPDVVNPDLGSPDEQHSHQATGTPIKSFESQGQTHPSGELPSMHMHDCDYIDGESDSSQQSIAEYFSSSHSVLVQESSSLFYGHVQSNGAYPSAHLQSPPSYHVSSSQVDNFSYLKTSSLVSISKDGFVIDLYTQVDG